MSSRDTSEETVGNNWQFHSMEITRWLEQEMRDYSSAELRNVEISQQSQDICPDLPVSSLLHPETVAVPLQARTKRSVLESLLELAGETWQIWSPSEILTAIQQREELMSTAYAGGVAIPHPRNPLPEAHGESIIAFGRTMTGIPFGAPHGGLTDLFFLILCQDSKSHLQVLARLGRMLQLPEFIVRLRETQDSQSAYDIICETENLIAAQDEA